MPAAKRRPKREDEILDLDYLANNSTLEGMLSHLKPELRTAFSDAFPAPIAGPSEPTGPVINAPDIAAPPSVRLGEPPITTGPIFTPPAPYHQEAPSGDPETTPLEDATADAGPLTIAGPPIKLPRGVALFRWKETPECHNRGEEQVRSKLWLSANNPKDDSLDRFIEIPQSYISRICGLGETQTRAALRSLIEKLAIVLEQDYHEDGRPRRYRIRSFKNLNHLRREAGLLWVLRQGPGVRLLDENGARGYLMNTGAAAITGAVIETFLGTAAPEITPATPPVTAGAAGPVTRPFLKGTNPEGREEAMSSSPVAELARRLGEWIRLDDDAVRQIWDACRRGTSDCTPHEVAILAGTKFPLVRSGKIDNPAGLLISSVPKFFENGGSMPLKQLREADRKRREDEARRERELVEIYHRILADPNTSEEDREWAGQMLQGA